MEQYHLRAEHFRGAQALLSLFWNEGFYRCFEHIFPGDMHPDYRLEWFTRWDKSYCEFWGALDEGRQVQLMELAMKLHGNMPLPPELFLVKDCTV